MIKLDSMPMPSLLLVTLGVNWLAPIHQLGARWLVDKQHGPGHSHECLRNGMELRSLTVEIHHSPAFSPAGG